MATLAYLLAPLRDIPRDADDAWLGRIQAWIGIADWAWFERWEQLPDDERARVRRMPAGTGLSGNAVDAMTFKDDPDLRASASAWITRAWDEWSAAGRHEPRPAVNSAIAHEVTGLDSRMSLANLTCYSGGFEEIAPSTLTHGACHAFIKHEGDPNAFGFGADDDIQKQLFLEIARGHGGDHVALWTFGHALNILVARSPSPGARPAIHGPFSWRTRPPAGCTRPAHALAALERALAGSAITPDLGALARELSKPALSIAGAFAAFGIAGARDFDSPDIPARWEDLDRVATALLTAQPVDRMRLKNLQQLLEARGERRLPARGKLGKGELGRRVAEAAFDVRETLGLPPGGVWCERWRAARCYWDIGDSPALDRLTVGRGRNGFGESAALTRVLAHFPEPRLRDPLFLAQLALECEGANAHAFVGGLFRLAEQTASAGLVLVVAEAARQKALRSAFGIERGAVADTPLCGEALICGTSLTKGDAAAAALAWMSQSAATGAVAELAADGTVKITYVVRGAPVDNRSGTGLDAPDHAALRTAALGFLPRSAFLALGAGDLLAPGEWREGSYAGSTGAGDNEWVARTKRLVDARFDGAFEPQPLASAADLTSVVGPYAIYRGDLDQSEGGIVSLLVEVPVDDEAWLRELRNDLAGQRLVDTYGTTWLRGRQVRAYTGSDIDLGLFGGAVGDAPPDTVIALAIGPEPLQAWRLTGC